MSVLVAVLTDNQAFILKKERFDDCCQFNPIRDGNGNWVISKEEIDNCTIEQHSTLLNALTLITFVP